MPGPVSDSYDPEWGTSANREQISNNLKAVHSLVSLILGGKKPIYIGELVQRKDIDEKPMPNRWELTEKQWRLIRFALERANESL